MTNHNTDKPVINAVLDKDGKPYGYTFWCPGCKESHQIFTNTDSANWEFNGNIAKPTFVPSYLTWLDPNPNASQDPKYKKYREGFRCHSFIKDGLIEFLGDCTHELAGKTVALEASYV